LGKIFGTSVRVDVFREGKLEGATVRKFEIGGLKPI
jgi:hypothetical protein